MANSPTDIPRLVATSREQYLRKEECRIRSLALTASRLDPQVRIHLDAVLGAEELIDIHDSAAQRQAAQGAHHFADTHRRFSALAWQLKLLHLHTLASTLI